MRTVHLSASLPSWDTAVRLGCSRTRVPSALSPMESPVAEAPSPDAPKLFQVLLPLLTLPGRFLGPFVEFGTNFHFVRNEVNRKANASTADRRSCATLSAALERSSPARTPCSGMATTRAREHQVTCPCFSRRGRAVCSEVKQLYR